MTQVMANRGRDAIAQRNIIVLKSVPYMAILKNDIVTGPARRGPVAFRAGSH
jgi:hypothetical protein